MHLVLFFHGVTTTMCVCACVQFAIVHLKDCPISAMILTWSKGKKVFAGLIPLEQVRPYLSN